VFIVGVIVEEICAVVGLVAPFSKQYYLKDILTITKKKT